MEIKNNSIHYVRNVLFGMIILFFILIFIFFRDNLGFWFNYWWMFPISLIIAIIVNSVGISGAVLFVPFFILIFPIIGISLLPEQSVKIGLITESFGLTSSTLAFLLYGLVDKKLGFSIIIKAIPFVILGAILSFFIPVYLFYFIIGATLLTSVYLLLNKERHESKQDCIKKKFIGRIHKKPHEGVTISSKDGKKYNYCRNCGNKKRFIGFSLGGLLQGMAGFGIGELGITSMVLTKIPLRIAIGTSHMIVASTAIIASMTHIFKSFFYSVPTSWNIVIMTVPGVIIGGQIAPYVAAKLEAPTLEKLVSLLFLIFSLILISLGINLII